MQGPCSGFPEWAAARRRELGLKQRDVGNLLGVTSTWVSQIERGGYRRRRWPTPYKIARICSALDLDVHEGLRIAGHAPMTDEQIAAVVEINVSIAAAGRATLNAGGYDGDVVRAAAVDVADQTLFHLTPRELYDLFKAGFNKGYDEAAWGSLCGTIKEALVNIMFAHAMHKRFMAGDSVHDRDELHRAVGAMFEGVE